MKEKILAALKIKFVGFQDAVLDRVAEKKAESVTDEKQVQIIVDGLNYDDIITSESDFKAEQISKNLRTKTISDYEKKHNLKDGKPIEPEKPAEPPKPDDDKDTPAWAKSLIENQKKVSETVTGLIKSQEKSSKQAQAAELIKKTKIPEKFRESFLKRINLDDEEKTIEDMVKEVEKEYLDLKQDLVAETVEGDEFGTGGKITPATDADMKEYLDNKFPESAEKPKI